MNDYPEVPVIQARTIIEKYGIEQTGKEFEYEGKTCFIGFATNGPSRLAICQKADEFGVLGSIVAYIEFEKIYKLRAECKHDLEVLQASNPRIKDVEIKLLSPPFPDCTMRFSSDLSLDEIRTAIRNVPDGHVMLQTVQPIEKYTGIRDDKLS